MAERSRERYRALVYEDPDFPRFFEQVDADRRADLAQHRLAPVQARRGRDRGAARDPVGLRVDAEPAAAAVVVRRGRRARRGRRSSSSARWRRGWPFFQGAALDARDGALQDRPRRRRALPAARRAGARASASGPTSRASTSRSSRGCWRSRARPALLDDQPALQRRLSHRNPWIDPLSHLQVELLARARDGPRRRARAAAGDDHRDRRRDAQHGLIVPPSRSRASHPTAGRSAAGAAAPYRAGMDTPQRARRRRAPHHRRPALPLRRPPRRRLGRRPARAASRAARVSALDRAAATSSGARPRAAAAGRGASRA